MLAPICLFTYNRLEETKHTVEALKNNYLAKESDLFIFSDGPKHKNGISKIEDVREYIKRIDGFKSVTIIESKENKGLANSIIGGVTHIINKYEKVIVLEDDLITSPNFLDFMNQALDFYNNIENIQSINGFSLKINTSPINGDIYFQLRPFPWGWATWKKYWDVSIFNIDKIKKIIEDNFKILKIYNDVCGNDMETMLKASISGKNNSWYVRWVFDHFINKRYSVFPIYSKVQNIGFADNATHCTGINIYRSENDLKNERTFDLVSFHKNDKIFNNEFLKYFKKSYKFYYRIRLLRNIHGRKQIKDEIYLKILSKYFL
jgi:hypothetical protein